MFSLKEFIKKGLLDAIGKMADYWVILNSVGWMEKGVLNETDLAEIQVAIDAQYVVEEPVEDEPIVESEVTEEIVDEEPEETEEMEETV